MKIDARVPKPEALDLNHLRATGMQPGEVAMEETDAAAMATSGTCFKIFRPFSNI